MTCHVKIFNRIHLVARSPACKIPLGEAAELREIAEKMIAMSSTEEPGTPIPVN